MYSTRTCEISYRLRTQYVSWNSTVVCDVRVRETVLYWKCTRHDDRFDGWESLELRDLLQDGDPVRAHVQVLELLEADHRVRRRRARRRAAGEQLGARARRGERVELLDRVLAQVQSGEVLEAREHVDARDLVLREEQVLQRRQRVQAFGVHRLQAVPAQLQRLQAHQRRRLQPAHQTQLVDCERNKEHSEYGSDYRICSSTD